MTCYPIAGSSVFYKTRDRYGELSNMHRDFPLRWKGAIINSSEALYQGLKFPLDLIIDYQGKRVCPAAVVMRQPSPKLSKKAAYLFPEYVRPDWVSENFRVRAMDYAIRVKYFQHRDAMDAVLDDTADRHIVEKSHSDDFWGAIPSVDGFLNGNNVLGLLWGLIRQERPTIAPKPL